MNRFPWEKQLNNILKVASAALAMIAATPSLAANASFGGAGFSIPDNDSVGVSSSVAVGPLGTINSISVSLNDLSHSWAGDLIATLSNGSTTISLFDRLGVPATSFGNSMNFDGTYSFSDSAVQVLPEANTGNSVIPVGLYLPAQAFSAFTGLGTSGTWTLNVSDNASADVGSLRSWTLNVDYSAGAVPEPATWAMMIGGLGLVGASMRRRKTAVSFA